MRVYMIALPVHDNAGKDLSGAHAAFQSICVVQFGGCTKRPSGEGQWYDDVEGRVHYDTMVPYEIAVPDGNAAIEPGVMSYLAGVVGPLFPDQKAFFIAEIGTAHIIKNHHRPRQPDKATRGAGKTDAAFEGAASAPVPPVKSSIGETLLLEMAKEVLQASHKEQQRLAKLNWALSEALRNKRLGHGSIDAVQDALFQLSISVR